MLVVLAHLVYENTALGFVGGFTGRKIEARLKPIGCGVEFIHVRDGDSRINIKYQDEVSERDIDQCARTAYPR